MNHQDYVSWTQSIDETAPNPISTSLIPRPTAWMAVYPPSSHDETGTNEPLVCLVEGYSGASDRPPTLMVGSDSVHPNVLEGLRWHGVCTLSVATKREWEMICDNHYGESRNAVRCMAADGGGCGPAKSFRHAGLKECHPTSSLQSILDSLPDPTTNNMEDGQSKHRQNNRKRPPAVDSSPVQMHCRLIAEITLSNSTMILLQIDTYVIHQCTLRTQTALSPIPISIQGNPDVRRITAKIDCLMLAPLGSLGNGRFGTVNRIHHMGRPRPKVLSKHNVADSDECELNEDTCNRTSWEDCAMWDIDPLVLAESNDNASADVGSRSSTEVHKSGDPVTFTYRMDPHCPLGYNPMKQVVCPRFIGWISTYEPSSLKRYDENGTKGNAEIPVAHISPYSFFMDVARGPRPMVAFAACPRSDEFADSDEEQDALDDDNATNNEKNNISDSWKDAQRDAEMTGCFCVNFVSQELAWAMNASAAPLGKGLSEFRLMESTASGNCNPTYVRAPNVNAPMVIQSPAVMECKYVKTTKIPDIFDNDSMYSLIIGEVVHLHVRKDCSLESSSINIESQHSNKCLELDLKKARPVARLGYGQEYAVIEEILK